MQDPDMKWPSQAQSDPDGVDAWRYCSLEEVDPVLATRLVSQFAPRWLRAAELPVSRVAEVPETVALKVCTHAACRPALGPDQRR
jgi:hypothetical protein